MCLRLQATSQGFDAIGFYCRSSKAQGRGTQQVPPPTELGESPGGPALAGLSLHPEHGRMAAAGRRRGTIPAHVPWLQRAGL